MTARAERFMDQNGQILSKISLDLEGKFKDNFSNLNTLLDEEKSASGAYAAAWTHATDRYETYYKGELSSNILQKINETIPNKVEEPLKSNPTLLPIAVIVCTENHGGFFDKFNLSTRQMCDSENWDSYPFKSLLLLVNLAQKYLPSKPDQKLNKRVFRAINTDKEFNVGQKLSLGYMAPFTVRRGLALGKTTKEDEDTDDVEAPEAVAPGVQRTIMRIEFSSLVEGLGVKLLSPNSDDEREVLIMPQQTFKVNTVRKFQDKGLRVIVLEPFRGGKK